MALSFLLLCLFLFLCCFHSVLSIYRKSEKEEIRVKLTHILRQRTEEIEVKKYAVKLLKEAGSFAYTKSVLEDLDARVRREVQKLGGNERLIKVMDDLKNWL